MANVIVNMEIKYRVTKKNAAGKEISQKFVKKAGTMVMTEAQFTELHEHTDALETVADFGDF